MARSQPRQAPPPCSTAQMAIDCSASLISLPPRYEDNFTLDQTAHPSSNSRGLTGSIATLEPLADYLAPQFGNIYEFNLPGADSFAVQERTDELRHAVKHYLVDEVSEDDYAAF